MGKSEWERIILWLNAVVTLFRGIAYVCVKAHSEILSFIIDHFIQISSFVEFGLAQRKLRLFRNNGGRVFK